MLAIENAATAELCPDARVSIVLAYSVYTVPRWVFWIELIHTYIHTYIHAASLYSRDFSEGPTSAL